MGFFKHAIRVASSALRERRKKRRRSPKWDELQRYYVREHPRCAACGGAKRLQVHHIEPFHLMPGRELDLSNLIGLCMGKHECHLNIGHGDNFKSFNPRVIEHAREALERPLFRAEVEKKAREARRS